MKLNYGLFTVTIGIFLLDITGKFFDWYSTVFWFDIPMHMLGGAWVALILLLLFREYPRISFLHGSSWMNIVIVVALTLSIAVGWEVFEFILSRTVGDASCTLPFPWQNKYSDTIYDIVFGIGGAFIVAFFFFVSKKSKIPQV